MQEKENGSEGSEGLRWGRCWHGSLVPGAAFALPGDGALPEQAAEDAAENGSWYAGGAIERMLAAGDYAEGRVLVRATGEFAPLSPYSNDVSAWSSSDLYAFGGDAGADARLRSAATEPDRVLLIQSETLSTEELLASLVGVPGVLAAQPDYVHVIEQPEPSSAEARAGEATGDAAPPTAPSAGATAPDPFIDEQWQLASTDDVEGGTTRAPCGNAWATPEQRLRKPWWPWWTTEWTTRIPTSQVPCGRIRHPGFARPAWV